MSMSIYIYMSMYKYIFLGLRRKVWMGRLPPRVRLPSGIVWRKGPDLIDNHIKQEILRPD